MNEIKSLIYKEILIEWRQKYALNGMILYLVSAIFVCYMSLKVKTGALEPQTWNALFWLIMLFNAINAIAKSFNQEHYTRQIYYYSIASAGAIILSKIIYNAFLMVFLSLGCYLFYSLIIGNPVNDQSVFVINLVLGASGFAGSLTLISAIASKTGNSSMFMAILSFPIVLPLIIMLIKVSKNAIDGLDRSVSYNELITIFAINVILITLSRLLFPYLWQS